MTSDTISQTVPFPNLFDKPLLGRLDRPHGSDGGAALLNAARDVLQNREHDRRPNVPAPGVIGQDRAVAVLRRTATGRDKRHGHGRDGCRTARRLVWGQPTHQGRRGTRTTAGTRAEDRADRYIQPHPPSAAGSALPQAAQGLRGSTMVGPELPGDRRQGEAARMKLGRLRRPSTDKSAVRPCAARPTEGRQRQRRRRPRCCGKRAFCNASVDTERIARVFHSTGRIHRPLERRLTSETTKRTVARFLHAVERAFDRPAGLLPLARSPNR